MSFIAQMCYCCTVILLYYLSQGCVGYDPEASITGLYTGPYFDPLAPRNLTAHLEDRAVLPCTVRQLGDKSVSWVRMRDADILTVDRYTFVSDERFEAHYTPTYETWNLIIKYVQERDAGMYECQVSTEPKMSQLFNLRVVVPRVSIVPPGDRYVKAGSKVKIDCHITDVVQQPDYIFWYHDAVRVLEQRDSNIEVNVKKTGEESLMSTLTISRVRRDESGNYTCMPSNLHSASVLLHVLNEEHPEAMKDGRNASGKMEQPIFLLLLFFLCIVGGRLFSDYSLPRNKIKRKEYFAGAIRDQSNSSPEEKCKKNLRLSNISNPQNRSSRFSNLEIRAVEPKDANLSLKDLFLFHQNDRDFLFTNIGNQNQIGNSSERFFEKFISLQGTLKEINDNLRASLLSRADDVDKLIETTYEHRPYGPEHSPIKPADDNTNTRPLDIDFNREYYELSIVDSEMWIANELYNKYLFKWIAIHTLDGKNFDKYLNKFQDFVESINIFPYNRRVQEDSSITYR